MSEVKVTLPDATIVTAPKVAADALIPFEHLNAGNCDKALAGYRQIKQIKKDTPDNAAISQFRLNGPGYGYMRAKKLPEAPEEHERRGGIEEVKRGAKLATQKHKIHSCTSSWHLYYR